MCGYKLAKFHENILSLSENTAESVREGGGYFSDSHCGINILPTMKSSAEFTITLSVKFLPDTSQ